MPNSVENALKYAEKLAGKSIQYRAWDGEPIGIQDDGFWTRPGLPTDEELREIGCSCAGLANLMRRVAGLSIPQASPADQFPGGTSAWVQWVKATGRARFIDTAPPQLERGSMLIRPFQGGPLEKQGHVAIVLNEGSSTQAIRIVHAFPDAGITITPLEIVDAWTESTEPYFRYAIPPMQWLS